MSMLQSEIHAGKISFNVLLALSLGIHITFLGGAALMHSRSSYPLPHLQSINVEIDSIEVPDNEVNPRVREQSLTRPAIVQAKSEMATERRPAKPLQQPEALIPAKTAEMPLPLQAKTSLGARPSMAAPLPAAPAQPEMPLQQPAASGKARTGVPLPDSTGRAYTALIRGMIDQQKEYPLMARKSGAEGTVYIKFVLARDGRLKRTEVSRSSGKNILDRAAINAVTRVNRFPTVPESMEGTEFSFELPLTFKIAGN